MKSGCRRKKSADFHRERVSALVHEQDGVEREFMELNLEREKKRIGTVYIPHKM